jgi:hypothetical protein
VGERWIDRSEWDSAICADLRPVLTFLEEQYGLRIAKIHLDMKAMITEVYLDGGAPPEAIEIIQRKFSSNANLRFWEKGAVSCSQDWTGVHWHSPPEAPQLPRKPWWKMW